MRKQQYLVALGLSFAATFPAFAGADIKGSLNIDMQVDNTLALSAKDQDFMRVSLGDMKAGGDVSIRMRSKNALFLSGGKQRVMVVE